MIPKQEAVQYEEPQWADSNQEGRESRRNYALRIGKSKVATHQKQDADGGEPGELECRETNAASGDGTVREHNQASNCETRRAHVGRRNLFDGDSNTEIS